MNILISTVKKFLSSKFNRYLLVILLILGLSAFYFTQDIKVTSDDVDFTVHFFYLPTCPHCSEQKPIIEELDSEMSNVEFAHYDASSSKGSSLFYQMAAEAGLDTSRLGVPTMFIGKRALVGFHTKEQIKQAVHDCMENCINEEKNITLKQELKTGFTDFELPFIGRKDLTKYSIPILAVILGLIDGFNPCAMWVLVYLIGLLIGVKDKKRIWIIVGSFVLASGILYFLFMTAWINIFLLLGYIRILTIIIGLVALGGGILSLKEYITTKGALECEVGNEESHEKTINKIKNIIKKPISIAIIFSIIGLAFVVNSVEFVCSSAIPAVFTQILAISGLSTIQNYMYIGLFQFYNIYLQK